MFVKFSNLVFNRKLYKIFIRNCHAEKKIRVRFAPSPTGYLHLGGLRTALYNYLFSRKNNGTFILRIEDTDRTRLVEGATQNLIRDIKWSGIEIDEGPEIGGQYGPYIQSERIHIYKQEVQKLIHNRTAYFCFCTERRLELLRKEAVRTRQIPKYDNKCRHLTPEQVQQKLSQNQPHCIRFILSSFDQPFNDIIYGNCSHDVSETEGDPIIMKSDGWPTYHLANVIDDHWMNITHVLRGIEWQISTPKHLLLYKAFGWKPPQYGHLPLLINPDGTKLSKRQGDIHVSHYREKGIFPRALVNYVMAAGGGFDHVKSAKRKSHTIKELAAKFDISQVNSHPSKLNPDLLGDFNRLELQEKISDEKSCNLLIDDVQNLVKIAYPKYIHNLDLDRNHIKAILMWSVSRITAIEELVEPKLSFLWIKPIEKVETNLDEDCVRNLIEMLESCETFEKDYLHNILKDFCNKRKMKFSTLMKVLRKILCGLEEGPGVAEMMNILGKKVAMNRIKYLIPVVNRGIE